MQPISLIFGSGLYFYAITILAQYGFNSYFGIPSNLIEPSLRDNIIFFFSIFRAITKTHWIVIIIAITIIISVIYALNKYLKLSKKVIIILAVILSIFGSYNLGSYVAKTNTKFSIVSSMCIPEQAGVTYIVPAFYQTNALVTPIYTGTNKLTGGFIVKDISEPGCELYRDEVGKILKQDKQ